MYPSSATMRRCAILCDVCRRAPTAWPCRLLSVDLTSGLVEGLRPGSIRRGAIGRRVALSGSTAFLAPHRRDRLSGRASARRSPLLPPQSSERRCGRCWTATLSGIRPLCRPSTRRQWPAIVSCPSETRDLIKEHNRYIASQQEKYDFIYGFASLWVTISQYAAALALEFENQAIGSPSKHRGLSS
jgi:hypothetical protein